MARGGQLGVSPAAPSTSWWQYLLYALGIGFAIWVMMKAFTPCPTIAPIKEKFGNGGCPCNKKKTSPPAWIPFAS